MLLSRIHLLMMLLAGLWCLSVKCEADNETGMPICSTAGQYATVIGIVQQVKGSLRC